MEDFRRIVDTLRGVPRFHQMEPGVVAARIWPYQGEVPEEAVALVRQAQAHWAMFDRGWADKLMSADLDQDGVLDTDVLIRNTPWPGRPPTDGYEVLEEMARMVARPGGRVEVIFPPGLEDIFEQKEPPTEAALFCSASQPYPDGLISPEDHQWLVDEYEAAGPFRHLKHDLSPRFLAPGELARLEGSVGPGDGGRVLEAVAVLDLAIERVVWRGIVSASVLDGEFHNQEDVALVGTPHVQDSLGADGVDCQRDAGALHPLADGGELQHDGGLCNGGGECGYLRRGAAQNEGGE